MYTADPFSLNDMIELDASVLKVSEMDGDKLDVIKLNQITQL